MAPTMNLHLIKQFQSLGSIVPMVIAEFCFFTDGVAARVMDNNFNKAMPEGLNNRTPRANEIKPVKREE